MAVVILLLLFAFLPQTAHATVTNFNPPNNIVVNGDFRNASAVVRQSPTGNAWAIGIWKLGLWKGNEPNSTAVYDYSVLNYSISVVDGKNAFVITVPAGYTFALWQSLIHVRVNSTTRVHAAFNFLTSTPPKNPYFGVFYGLFAPVYDRLYGTGPSGSAPGAVFFPDPSKTNQWQILDDNLNHLAGQNITGWFFDCPAAEDITIGPLYSTNTSYTVAITDIAVYDFQPSISQTAGAYTLHLYSTPGGSVSPGNSTYPYGSNVTIKAAPSQNYTFIRWIGYGTGSYSGPNNPASVTMSSNITEIAIFQPRPIVQTVYIPKYINNTVYVPEYINRTVYVNIPYIPWWVWVVVLAAVVEAFIIIALSFRERRKQEKETGKKEEDWEKEKSQAGA